MFCFLTAGESHGRALTAIIEGVPAGLALDEDYIAHDLKRRQGGYGRGGRMAIEQDRAEILSGVWHGLTMGSPISLLILNRDWENWQQAMSISPVEQDIEPLIRLRPGHADLAGAVKYNLDDVRPILERASARETATRVLYLPLAALFMIYSLVLPLVYGALVMPNDFPLVNLHARKSAEIRIPEGPFFLIHQGERSLVLWHGANAASYVIPSSEITTLEVIDRASLFSAPPSKPIPPGGRP